MSEHVIDSSEPYHPDKLEKKDYVGAAAYFELDLRTGIILKVEEFPVYWLDRDERPGRKAAL